MAFLRRSSCSARAANHRPQARQQFPCGKSLGKIIVGANFQSGYPVRFVSKSCQHQDGHTGLFSQAASATRKPFIPGSMTSRITAS